MEGKKKRRKSQREKCKIDEAGLEHVHGSDSWMGKGRNKKSLEFTSYASVSNNKSLMSRSQ